MSMNILVETRIASESIFRKENPTLMAGEFAINNELTGIKIGDGKKSWEKLDYLNVPREVINKWHTMANGVTKSHLVTLPDINFAYTTVNVDSNPLIENIVDTIIKNKNFFTLEEIPAKTNSLDFKYDTLVFSGSEIFDTNFATSEEKGIGEISRLGFVSKF